MDTNLVPLKVFGTGQVTLPKRLRDKYKALYYIAEETENGIFLRPLTKAIYYEKSSEEFGIKFPFEESATNVLKNLKKANERLSKVSSKTSKKSKK
jgi:bifunctional DNA-binding transcriptional regulator/antitoxin component of YhaV-PrlF toxin-antitoxin module